MDRERLGRVLGKGARIAARTALEAVDAATAPSPAGTTMTSAHPHPVQRTTYTPQNLRSATRAAGAGALAPLRHASRALWHELTGSFFALFTLSFGVGVWHTRGNLFSTLPSDRYRFFTVCGLALLFAWFSISSFLRARRRA